MTSSGHYNNSSEMLERIANNDPAVKTLCLDRSVEEYGVDVGVMANALRQNTTIDSVRFDRDFLCSLSNEQQHILLGESIGGIDSLRKLSLNAGSIDVSALADFMRDATGLEHLSLRFVTLSGTQNDFKSLELSLFGHKNLRDLVLSDFHLSDQSISLDCIVRPLRSIKKLSTVKLQAGRDIQASFTATSLCLFLGGTRSLREFHLSGFRLEKVHSKVLANKIQQTTADNNLRSLHLLRVGLDDGGVAALATALKENRTLERLDLSSNVFGDDGCTALCDGLSSNKALRLVRLFGNKNVTSKGWTAFADMLTNNTTIERLEAPLSSDACQVAIDQRLRKNRSTAMAA